MQTSYSIKNTSIVNYPCTKLSSRRISHLFKDGLMEFKYRKRNRIHNMAITYVENIKTFEALLWIED